MADEVLTERRGRTLIITINRPEARNAINAAVSHGLAAAVEELDGNDELSLAVLTGAGGNFCGSVSIFFMISCYALLQHHLCMYAS